MSGDDITEARPDDADPGKGPKIGPPGVRREGGGAGGMLGSRAMDSAWDAGPGYGGYGGYGRDADYDRSGGWYREEPRGGYGRGYGPYGGSGYGGGSAYGGGYGYGGGMYGGMHGGGYGGAGSAGYGSSGSGGYTGGYGGPGYGEWGSGLGGGYRSGGSYDRDYGAGEFRGYGGYGSWREAGGVQEGRGWGSMAHGRMGERVHAERLMTHDPRTVAEDATIVDAAGVLVQYDVDAVPVVGGRTGRTLRGMLAARDVVRAVARRLPPETPVSEVMDASPATIQRFDGIEEMRLALRRSGSGRVPVVDREGRLVGIVARADLEAWNDPDDRYW